MRTLTNINPTCQPHRSKLASIRHGSDNHVTMAEIRTQQRTVGLDIGDRRIGVAVSDGLGLTAQPLGVVRRQSAKTAISAIMELLSNYDVGSFVAGLPLNMNGSEGTQADRVRHFCDKLKADTGIPVIFQDERLTSAQGERVLIEAGMRRNKRRDILDITASVLILQSHLDACGENRNKNP